MDFRMLSSVAALSWCVSLAGGTPAAQSGSAGDLPPGAGQETVLAICGDCHDPDVVAGQRRTRREWENVVEDMAERSGVATEEDIETIVQYLAVQFGRVNINTAPPGEIVAIVGLSESEAKAIAEFRAREGNFETIEDLRQVPGVDFAKIQERKDRIVFAGR